VTPWIDCGDRGRSQGDYSRHDRQASGSFETNHTRSASPMTDMFDDKQYVAVAAASNIIALAIQE
jgi:hypothetical protein